MRKFIIAALMLLISSSAFALDGVEWGVKGGLNLAKITKTDDGKIKPSIYIGGFATYKFNDIVAIQPELIYSRQGVTTKQGGVKYQYRINYINLPILAKLYVLENLTVDLGPQFGFVLNSKINRKSGGTSVKTSASDMVKKFDVSFAMGVTYTVIGNIDLSFRYNLGLTKAIKAEFGDKRKNSVIQLGAGYRF